MFADDSALLYRGSTPKETSQGLAKDVETVTEYFNSLNLLLNVGKTKVIHFDRLVSGKNLLKVEILLLI